MVVSPRVPETCFSNDCNSFKPRDASSSDSHLLYGKQHADSLMCYTQNVQPSSSSSCGSVTKAPGFLLQQYPAATTGMDVSSDAPHRLAVMSSCSIQREHTPDDYMVPFLSGQDEH